MGIKSIYLQNDQTGVFIQILFKQMFNLFQRKQINFSSKKFRSPLQAQSSMIQQFLKDKSLQDQSFCQLNNQKEKQKVGQQKCTIGQNKSQVPQNYKQTEFQQKKVFHEQKESIVLKDKKNLFKKRNKIDQVLNIFIQSVQQQISSFQHINLPQVSYINQNFEHIKSQLGTSLTSVLGQYEFQSQIKLTYKNEQHENNQFQTLQFNQNCPYRNECKNQKYFHQQTFSRLQNIMDKLILLKSISFSTQIAPLLHTRQMLKIQKVNQLQKKNNQTIKQNKINLTQFQHKINQTLKQHKNLNQLQHKNQQEVQNNDSIKQILKSQPSQAVQQVQKNKSQQNLMECSLKFEKLQYEQQKMKKYQQQIDKISQDEQSFQDLNVQKCQKQSQQKMKQKEQQIFQSNFKQQQQALEQVIDEKQEQKIKENLENNAQNKKQQVIKFFLMKQNQKIQNKKVLQEKDILFNKDISLNKDMKQIIQQQVRYLIHFSQITIEVVIELSSNKSQSLSYAYNVVRFLITNFIIHFRKQAVLKIKQQAKQTLNNQLLFAQFQQTLNNSLRYKDCQCKLSQLQRAVIAKINNYEQKLSSISSNQLKQPKNTNASKFSYITKEKPQLIQLLKKLNNNEVKQYNFQTVKQIYRHMVTLAKEEFMNQKYLDKCFKKLAKSQNLKVINMDIFLQRITQFSFTKKKEKKLFNKMLILILQQIKISNILLSLPFYSFANQMENDQRKITNCRDFDKNLREIMDKKKQKMNIFKYEDKFQQKQQEFKEVILRNMDSFYIMKGFKINSENWQIKLKKDQFQFYQDAQYYLCLHQGLMNLVNKDEKKQLSQKKEWISGYSAMKKYQNNNIKPIQYGRYSIFHQQEQKYIQYLIKSTLKNKKQPTLSCFNNKTIKKLKKAINSIWNVEQDE